MSNWFGFAASFGGHLGIWGYNTMVATFYSMDSAEKNFVVKSERSRWGPGLGGTTGVDFMAISNVDSIWDLNGMETSTWDFNIAIGAKWGTMLKNTAKSKKLIDTVKKLSKGSGMTTEAMKQATKLDPGDYAEVVKKAREMVNNAPTKDSSKPQVMNVGIPVTPGLELSLYQQYGEWQILDVRL